MKISTFIAFLIISLQLSAQTFGKITADIFNTGVETSNEDRGGWYQGIAAFEGYVFFHRLSIDEGRKQASLVRVDPERNLTLSQVIYSESIENHSHGGCHMLDGKGRIHTIYGASPGHIDSDGLQHLVSDKALNVQGDFSEGKGFPTGINGTYRHFDRAPNGDIYAFIKDVPEDGTRSGEGHLWHWDNNASRWNFVAVVNAEYRKTTYSPYIAVDSRGKVHLSWHWANGYRSSPNRHLGSYAMYDPETKKFYKADGTEYTSMPITTDNADAWQPLEPGVKWDEPEMRDSRMWLDGYDRPVMEYRYLGGNARIARWDGKQWVRTEHPFRPGNDPEGMLSVHGTNLYFFKDADLHVSEDWGKTWKTHTIAPGLTFNCVAKAGENQDVVLYYKEKDGPMKDIYIAYVDYGSAATPSWKDSGHVPVAKPESPEWWIRGEAGVQEFMENHIRKGELEVIAVSPGGRKVYMVTYGETEPHLRGTANYNSALGANNPDAYFQRDERERPVMVVLGGVHGSEPEGVMTALSLINIMETGKNMMGTTKPEMKNELEKLRLIIIPLANPDGMARYPYTCNVGLPLSERVKWAQGTDSDGNVWPSNVVAKGTHPMVITEDGILGSYYDDNGVNLMHDQFFTPFSTTTEALLRMVDIEGPDILLNLHSLRANPVIFSLRYVPVSVKEELAELTRLVYSNFEKEGIVSGSIPSTEPDGLMGQIPPSFNLNSAFYHAGAALPFTFEFPFGDPGFRVLYNHHSIMKIGEVLIDTCLEYLLNP
jgi:hypothetical protein